MFAAQIFQSFADCEWFGLASRAGGFGLANQRKLLFIRTLDRTPTGKMDIERVSLLLDLDMT